MNPQKDFLTEDNTDKNPFRQFSKWYNLALNSGFLHPDAMMLATADKMGKPSARIVLLKGFDEKGFIFFTNYESKKGVELAQNPYAALLFYWDKLDKQVRIEGSVEKTTRSESEEYFKTRPRGSQLGAWASEQSKVIPNRGIIEKKFEELDSKYKDREIPLPDFWGGYRLVPENFEFWYGRENRLHDRIRYVLEGGKWKIERLAP